MNVGKDKTNDVTTETPIDFSRYDDVLLNMFRINPTFFKGILSDEKIEQQEQKIRELNNKYGVELSHEDRMCIFRELMKESRKARHF